MTFDLRSRVQSNGEQRLLHQSCCQQRAAENTEAGRGRGEQNSSGRGECETWRPLTLTLSAPQVVQRPANAIKEMMENWYANAGTIFILLRVFVVV